jgi:hypothetical protein
MNEHRVLRELVKTKTGSTRTSKQRGFAGSLLQSPEKTFLPIGFPLYRATSTRKNKKKRRSNDF